MRSAYSEFLNRLVVEEVSTIEVGQALATLLNPDNELIRRSAGQLSHKDLREPQRKWFNFKSPEAWRESWTTKFLPLVTHDGLSQFEIASIRKYGPQGGTIPWDVRLKLVDSYYSQPPDMSKAHPSLARAVAWLQLELQAHFLNAVYSSHFTGKYVYDGHTLAGLPFSGTKADPLPVAFMEVFSNNRELHVPLPTLSGTRFQRQKPRAIFMDAHANVAVLMPRLDGIRHTLKQFDFYAGYLSPVVRLRPSLTKALQHSAWFLSVDYTAFDQTVHYEHVRDYVQPIWDLIAGQDDFFNDFVKKLFRQPLVVGRVLKRGVHSLFSGQGITNDAETVIDLVLCVAVFLEMGLDPSNLLYHTPRRGGAGVGDDVILWFDTKELAEAGREAYMRLAESVGFKVNMEKTSVTQEPIFLRRMFAKSFPKDSEGNVIGAYPSALTLNSLINPERSTLGWLDSVYSVFQILDNLHGHPQWVAFCQQFFAAWRKDLFVPATLDGPVSSTWKQKLWGDEWKPSSSATVRLLREQPYGFESLLALIG